MAGLEGAAAGGGSGGGGALSTEVFDFLPSVLNILDEVIDNEEEDDDASAANPSAAAAAASNAPAELQQQLAKARAYLASLPCIGQSLPELQGDLEAARAQLAQLQATQAKLRQEFGHVGAGSAEAAARRGGCRRGPPRSSPALPCSRVPRPKASSTRPHGAARSYPA